MIFVKLTFVTYWGEGFIGKKSDTLVKFYENYPQINLNEEDQNTIFNYLQKLNKNNDNDFNKFFGSMQLIIFFLINNKYKNDEIIFEIIKNAPDYLEIDEDCFNFFKEEGKEFRTNQIMNIF